MIFTFSSFLGQECAAFFDAMGVVVSLPSIYVTDTSRQRIGFLNTSRQRIEVEV